MFQCRLFQSFDLVEQAMIKRSDNVLYDLFYLPQIAHPAFVSLGVPAQGHAALKAMAVNFLEQIIGVRMAKIVRRFELKIFLDLEQHGRIN